MKKIILIPIITIIVFTSCKRNRFDDIDISNIPVSVSINRFENDLFAINPDSIQNSLPALRAKYGHFVDLFGQGIIGIGKPTDAMYYKYFRNFLTDTMVQNAYALVQKQYPNTDELEQKLTDAFKRFQYHFPNKSIPQIYTYVSGYNLSIALDDSVVAIGLDRYLGDNLPQYRLLGIPRYLVHKMNSHEIPSDVVRAWLYGEFSFNDSIDNLISNMIYEGELIYLTKHLLPSQTDTLTYGFTAEQLKWCKNNEEQMWTSLIENKMLFTTNSLDIHKYINDAPFTSGFPNESPGRAAVWIGSRIVESFMNKNKTLSLQDLMNIKDYQKILNMSRYKP